MRTILHRPRGDRGATLVEFALVGSLLFTLIFAAITMGLVEIGNSVGSNASREGARVGSINFACADGGTYSGCPSPSTTNATLIAQAVNKRLVGLVRNVQIDVRCLDGTSTDLSYSTSKNCDPASISVGTDLIEVKVRWTQLVSSAFTTGTTHSEISRLVIGGPPGSSSTATTTPSGTPCKIISATITPNPEQLASGSQNLASPLQVIAVTNGHCTTITATYPTSNFGTGSYPSNILTDTMVPVAGTSNYSDTVSPSAAAWTTDSGLVTGGSRYTTQEVDMTDFGGVGTLNQQFAISSCVITGVTYTVTGTGTSVTSAAPAPLNAAYQLQNPGITVTVATNGDPSCAGLSLQANYPTAATPFTDPLVSNSDILTSVSGVWNAANPQTVVIETTTGNVMFTSTGFYVSGARPNVSSCSPISIPKHSSNVTLQITGTGFVNGASVSFSRDVSQTPSTSIVVTATTITMHVDTSNGNVIGDTVNVTVTVGGVASSGGTSCITIT